MPSLYWTKQLRILISSRPSNQLSGLPRLSRYGHHRDAFLLSGVVTWMQHACTVDGRPPLAIAAVVTAGFLESTVLILSPRKGCPGVQLRTL